MVLIYTTCRNAEEAKKIGTMLLEKHLAVCVNIWPITSLYSWQGKLKEDAEAALLIKTSEPKVADIEAVVLANHSYDVPFVGVVEVKRLNREYREWMSQVIH